MKYKLKLLYKFFLGLFYFFKFQIIEREKIRKANIVLFIPYYHTGGAEKVHLDILKAIKLQKCCVIFTHLSATDNFYEDFKTYASILELNSIRNKKSAFLNKALKKNILKCINISKSIHTVFGCNTHYFYELLPEIKTKIKRIDLIHALSEDDEREDTLAINSKFVDYRVCINTKAKNDLKTIYKKYNIRSSIVERLIIIENGVDVSRASKLTIQNNKNIKFGFIGRWSDEKRPEVFLEVAKQIQGNYPNIEFVMAGTGMKSNLKKIHEARVNFLGEISNQAELNKLYKSLTGIIIPSVYEGFPMVMMESMIFGVIPLSTNVGGISQHIKHLDNGILVYSKTYNQLVQDFVKGITLLIENEKEKQQLAISVKKYAISNFSIEKFNSSYQNLFKVEL